MSTHPAILHAETFGVATDNADGQAETLLVLDLDTRAVEVDIDGLWIGLLVNDTRVVLSPHNAERIAAALILGANEARERQP